MRNTFYELEGSKIKVNDNQEKGDLPDFKDRLEISACFNTDKNGNKYLSVVICNRVNLFKNNQKQEDLLD